MINTSLYIFVLISIHALLAESDSAISLRVV